MSSLQSPAQQCTMCGKLSSQRCKQCFSSSYCSRECQKTDWPVHKVLCSKFVGFSTAPTGHRRAIFFPVDEKAPKFVWVKCEWRTADGSSHEHVDIETYLGDGVTDRVWVQENKLRNRSREDAIIVRVRESGLLDGSKINRSAIAVAQGRYMNFCWPGPLLVLRSAGLDLCDSSLVDMDMVDFRDTVDVLCSYPDININVGNFGPEAHVLGVRINCEGEQTLYGRDKFEAIRVSLSDPVFEAPVPRISRLVGLPVKVIRASSDKLGPEYGRSNQEATFLHLNANPGDAEWGWAPFDWQEPAGNVIVVREDRRPLVPQHMDALCYFCKEVLQPLFDESMQTGDSRAKAKVMARLAPKGFRSFYAAYDQRKKESDPKWKSTECPV